MKNWKFELLLLLRSRPAAAALVVLALVPRLVAMVERVVGHPAADPGDGQGITPPDDTPPAR